MSKVKKEEPSSTGSERGGRWRRVRGMVFINVGPNWDSLLWWLDPTTYMKIEDWSTNQSHGLTKTVGKILYSQSRDQRRLLVSLGTPRDGANHNRHVHFRFFRRHRLQKIATLRKLWGECVCGFILVAPDARESGAVGIWNLKNL